MMMESITVGLILALIAHQLWIDYKIGRIEALLNGKNGKRKK